MNQFLLHQKLWKSRGALLAALFLLSCGLFSCKKMLPSNIFPYSMVRYQPGKFIDQTEITVEQYAEFIYDGNQDRKPAAQLIQDFKHYQVFYPSQPADSLFRAFGKLDYYDLPVPFEYFDTLNYTELRQILDFPITGITHGDALAYCQWRTQKYNEQLTNHTKREIEFVLPDEIIFLPEQPLDAKKYTEASIFPVKSKKHAKINEKKVFGLQSNVAEMSGTKGQLYGESSVGTAPHKNVGFRCVGIVK